MIPEQAPVTVMKEGFHMDIRITEKLREFRKQKGNTQEELANYLKISVQAVSKWERGDGFPDIVLLPAIALFYHTSVDNLLGCGEIEKRKRKEEYHERYLKNGNNGKSLDNIELMHAALKEFPDDEGVMYDLFQALAFINGDDYLDECIKVGEKILAHNYTEIPKYTVIQHLAFVYNRKGDLEAAEKYANMLPEVNCSRSSVLEVIKSGEELRKISQQNVMWYIMMIYQSVNSMLRSKEYSVSERILALESLVKLYDLFINDENYQWHTTNVMSLWAVLA